MSRHEQILRTPSAAAEPGQELAVVGGPSLFTRLARMFGRKPTALRLLAAPRDPIAGDPQTGAALLTGRFVVGRHDVAIDGLDPADGSIPDAVAARLHDFLWLRDLAAAATHERGWRVAEGLMRIWLDASAGSAPAWRADRCGRRVLSWTTHAPYLLSTREPDYRGRVLGALARSGREAARGGNRLPAGLARITAWSGAVASALSVQGVGLTLVAAEKGLGKAVASGLHDDGGLISRAPTQQLELVELLATLRAVYASAGEPLPGWLEEAGEGALSALLCVTSGDAGLSSWQGGNPGDARRLVAAVEAGAANSRPLREARGWGYQRLQAKDAILIADAGPPPPASAYLGGCASTLGFEFCDGAQRVIVNCGGAGAAAGALPDELAHLLRSTAAQSTLTLGDCNSTALLPDRTLGKGVGRVDVERHMVDGNHRLAADHDGYVRRFGLRHRRELVLAADGRGLTGQDELLAAGRPRSDAVPFAVRFHLAPGIDAAVTADGRGALLRLPGKRAWQFRCRGGVLAVEESLWLDGTAAPLSTVQLVVSGEAPGAGAVISWELVRAK